MSANFPTRSRRVPQARKLLGDRRVLLVREALAEVLQDRPRVLPACDRGAQCLDQVVDTYSACAIALIGTLPDTLHDRAISIDLKRRLRSETIEPYRPDRACRSSRRARPQGSALGRRQRRARRRCSQPDMPDGIINREADKTGGRC